MATPQRALAKLAEREALRAGAGEPRPHIVSVGISVLGAEAAAEQVLAWSEARTGRYVTLTNIHMVMEAHDSPSFRDVVEGADLVLPDGMPTVWAQRLFGYAEASRVPGPQFTELVLSLAAERGVPVGFYGGSDATLWMLVDAARARWPRLDVAVAIAPPFRPPTVAEDRDYTDRIVQSGARIVLVGIGCPKQERWMAEHVAAIPAVLLGVGQAFDILAGVKRDAPIWTHNLGLGWLFRLLQEPRRLWRRYAYNNPRFLALLLAQWLR